MITYTVTTRSNQWNPATSQTITADTFYTEGCNVTFHVDGKPIASFSDYVSIIAT